MKVRQFKQMFQAVPRPNNGSYNEVHTVWNAMVNRYPAVIAHYAGIIAGINAVAIIGVMRRKLRALHEILSDH